MVSKAAECSDGKNWQVQDRSRILSYFNKLMFCITGKGYFMTTLKLSKVGTGWITCDFCGLRWLVWLRKLILQFNKLFHPSSDRTPCCLTHEIQIQHILTNSNILRHISWFFYMCWYLTLIKQHQFLDPRDTDRIE